MYQTRMNQGHYPSQQRHHVPSSHCKVSTVITRSSFCYRFLIIASKLQFISRKVSSFQEVIAVRNCTEKSATNTTN